MLRSACECRREAGDSDRFSCLGLLARGTKCFWYLVSHIHACLAILQVPGPISRSCGFALLISQQITLSVLAFKLKNCYVCIWYITRK